MKAVNKLWTLFKREFLTRVKTKGFIIGTLLTPLFSEILLSIVILILTSMFLFWLAGKIFRAGILMYG